MGSWTELDAFYPENALTPATAFVVALGTMHGAKSIYAEGPGGRLAGFLPAGIVPTADLIRRVERYFRDVPLEVFLAEARTLLNPQQRRCLLVNLYDAALATGEPPESHPQLGVLLHGLGATAEELQPYRATLAVKNDLSIFHQ